MCKLGDIIVVRNYIGDGGNQVNQHSFVVIDDQGDTIYGLDYTLVAATMSSFKDIKHRKKKLKYKENMLLPKESILNGTLKKDGYIKADQAYFFNKSKTNYYPLARLNEEYLDELLSLVLILAKDGKLKQITANL